MLLTIINLYGTYRGFLRIKETNIPGECITESRGIPEGTRIFLVRGSLPFEIETGKNIKLNIAEIRGALAAQRCDGAWNIIMQGAMRGNVKNVENAKRVLWSELNSPVSNDKKPQKKQSEALKNILSEAEQLFSDDRHEENNLKAKTKENTQNVNNRNGRNNFRAFNPFNKTYPESTWQRKRIRNGYMLEGTVRFAGETLYAQAIPDNYAGDRRMLEKMGFTRLIHDDNGRTYLMRMKYIPKDKKTKG